MHYLVNGFFAMIMGLVAYGAWYIITTYYPLGFGFTLSSRSSKIVKDDDRREESPDFTKDDDRRGKLQSSPKSNSSLIRIGVFDPDLQTDLYNAANKKLNFDPHLSTDSRLLGSGSKTSISKLNPKKKKIVDIKNTPFANYNKSDWVLYFIDTFGMFDGDHHKNWVLDQIARIEHGAKIIIQTGTSTSVEGKKEPCYYVKTAKPTQKYYDWVQAITAGDSELYDVGIAP